MNETISWTTTLVSAQQQSYTSYSAYKMDDTQIDDQTWLCDTKENDSTTTNAYCYNFMPN